VTFRASRFVSLPDSLVSNASWRSSTSSKEHFNSDASSSDSDDDDDDPDDDDPDSFDPDSSDPDSSSSVVVPPTHDLDHPASEPLFETNAARGCSFVFSKEATHSFLERNELAAIVRAHEVQEEGYAKDFVDLFRRRAIAPVTTVFSAPNYCGKYGNDAAVLVLGVDRAEAVVFDAVNVKKTNDTTQDDGGHLVDDQEDDEHAESDAVRKAYEICPYMPSSFRAIVNCATDLLDEGLVKKVAAAEKRQKLSPPPSATKEVGEEKKKLAVVDEEPSSRGGAKKADDAPKAVLSPLHPQRSVSDTTTAGADAAADDDEPKTGSVAELRSRFERKTSRNFSGTPSCRRWGAADDARTRGKSTPPQLLSSSSSLSTPPSRRGGSPTGSSPPKRWPSLAAVFHKAHSSVPSSAPPTRWIEHSPVHSGGSPPSSAPTLLARLEARRSGPLLLSQKKKKKKNEKGPSPPSTNERDLDPDRAPASPPQAGSSPAASPTSPTSPTNNNNTSPEKKSTMQAALFAALEDSPRGLFPRRRDSASSLKVRPPRDKAKSRRFSAAVNGDAFNEMAPQAAARRVRRTTIAAVLDTTFVDSGPRGKNTILDAQRDRVTDADELRAVRDELQASRRVTSCPVNRAVYEKAAAALGGFPSSSSSSSSSQHHHRHHHQHQARRSLGGVVTDGDSDPPPRPARTTRRRGVSESFATLLAAYQSPPPGEKSSSFPRRDDETDHQFTMAGFSTFPTADDARAERQSDDDDNNDKEARDNEMPPRASLRRVNSDLGATTPVPKAESGFSDQEIYALRLIFSLFDIDGSGSIDRDELTKYADEVNECVSPKDVDRCIEAIDSDGDRCVTLKDWVVFAAKLKAAWELQEAALGPTTEGSS